MHTADCLLQVQDLDVTLVTDGVARPIVSQANLTLRRGEIAALVGESGSGKTLLTRSLVGLLPVACRVSAGLLRFRGADLLSLDAEAMRAVRGAGIGFVFQEPLSSLNPTVRIGTQLTESLRVHHSLADSECRARALEMLGRVRIADPDDCMRRYPHELSGGMRQRVMIASALVTRPELLIADEPTTALDALVQKDVLELMREAAHALGAAMLVVTHDLSVVAEVAETLHVMERGRIVEQGPAAGILAQPSHPYTQKLLAATPSRWPRRQSMTQPSQPERLEIDAISVSYAAAARCSKSANTEPALRDVSFALEAGELLAVVGQSGCGKTTLGRAIAGLQPLHSGEIRLAGRNLRDIEPAQRRIQYIFQDPWSALDPRMRIGDIIAEGLLFRRDFAAARRRQAVLDALEKVGLPAELERRRPHELSGGQRQRVNIARAIVVEPRFIVADEPVSALDLTVQKQVLELLCDLRDKLGFGCLLVSHDLTVVERLSDRTAVMQRGRLVEIGPTPQVFRQPQHAYTQQLLGAASQGSVHGAH